MDHTEGDRRINEGKDVVVEKEWQKFWRKSSNSSSNRSSRNRSTVDTMSVLMSE